ncbi:MAG TPA: FAD-dependent oxidoreductase, partial [Rheinheimera sp.]|uniref:FAD-dependent oxidoreductase n=1 Tax=Rheinheimera sp. TaxID=1869214 RepID=UPI002F93819A
MHNNDITIVGAGSAGLTLALLLAATGLKITVLEQGNAPSQQLVQHQRVSALNLASMRLLDHIGAWPAIAATAAAYHQMQVWDADSFGRIEFSAGQERLSQLGWI